MTREEELKELKYGERMSVVVIGERKGIRTICECPTCGGRVYACDRLHYCFHCGQNLDWSVLDD